MTLAATLATAPLIAHDFERISATSLAANLLALPAIAPVMWIGMLIGMLGQVPGFPTAPLGAVEGVLIDYVALVAGTLASPSWAELGSALPGPGAVIAVYLACSAAAAVLLASLRRRRRLIAPRSAGIGVALAVLAGLVIALTSSGAGRAPPAAALRVTGIDVGQGDAILLEPPRGDPVLVDAGPPGGAAAEALADLGVDRLAAVFVTHDQLDHAGGLREVLAAVPVGVLVRGAPSARARGRRAGGRRARRSPSPRGARCGSAACGSTSSGRRGTRPPRRRTPNDDSLVLAAGFRGWDVLLTGDAEAGGDPPRSRPVRRAQGRPPRQRRRRARSAPRPLGAAGRPDRGRRRQLLRPSDGGDARRAGGARRLHAPHRSRRRRDRRARPLGSHSPRPRAAAISGAVPAVGRIGDRTACGRRLIPVADQMRSAYLFAGDDAAKLSATLSRLRSRAEREGGPGALEDFSSGGGAAPDADALVGAIPAMSPDRGAPLPARRRGRALEGGAGGRADRGARRRPARRDRRPRRARKGAEGPRRGGRSRRWRRPQLRRAEQAGSSLLAR